VPNEQAQFGLRTYTGRTLEQAYIAASSRGLVEVASEIKWHLQWRDWLAKPWSTQ